MNIKLLRSEIKKAEKAGTKKAGKPVIMTGWFYDGNVSEFNTIEIKCEMCSNNMQDREEDVTLVIWLDDRRKSFAI